VAAMAAVSALLLVGSVNHLSPLPPGLSLPPEVLQLPFRKAQPVVTVLHGGVGEDGCYRPGRADHDRTERTDSGC